MWLRVVRLCASVSEVLVLTGLSVILPVCKTCYVIKPIPVRCTNAGVRCTSCVRDSLLEIPCFHAETQKTFTLKSSPLSRRAYRHELHSCKKSFRDLISSRCSSSPEAPLPSTPRGGGVYARVCSFSASVLQDDKDLGWFVLFFFM